MGTEAVRLYIGGTFDTFHSGHINLLKRCKELGTVIVSLNTDEFCERYKRRPYMPLDERIAILQACKYVDEVIVNTGNEDSTPAILASHPTHIVHGDDWTGDALMKQMGLTQDFLDSHHIQLYYLPYTPGISSTQLKQRNDLK